jgi:hypothetical protein
VSEAVATVPARWVSTELLTRSRSGPTNGRVLASFDAAVYADLGDCVVAVTPAGRPRMPNGLTISAGFGGPAWPLVGERAVLGAGNLSLGRLTIAWNTASPPGWDPEVPVWVSGRDRLRERARLVLAACLGRVPDPWHALRKIRGFADTDGEAAGHLGTLVTAIRKRDPEAGARAARGLTGRGSGLTPVGDDVLAATALTVAAAGGSCGFTRAARREWLAALAPPGLRRRTTSVSATMLELATRGRGIEPAHELLDPGPVPALRVEAAAQRISRLGHTTGAAYGVAIGACGLALAGPGGELTNHPIREKVT